jgi:flagellar protein FlbT
MLRISLRDGEKAILNGAVLRASGRVTLYLENHAAVLRGRDVMRPEDADTPARQLYFACMLAYIDPENREQHQQSILALLPHVVALVNDSEAHVACVRFAHEAARGDYYKALGAARELIAFEAAATAPAADADAA